MDLGNTENREYLSQQYLLQQKMLQDTNIQACKYCKLVKLVYTNEVLPTCFHQKRILNFHKSSNYQPATFFVAIAFFCQSNFID